MWEIRSSANTSPLELWTEQDPAPAGFPCGNEVVLHLWGCSVKRCQGLEFLLKMNFLLKFPISWADPRNVPGKLFGFQLFGKSF